MNCPACKSPATEQGFEGSTGARVQLDVCHTCHGLWFDAQESRQLTSKGVLRLFRELHGHKDQHYRLKEPLACPRCRTALGRTHDMARGNRFQYYRCMAGHGHFITFFQFLREKGIVRGLTPKELTELKKHVQALQCSDCGGPISLAKDTACPRCSAPLCILDPKALGSTLGDIPKAAAVAGAVVAPAVAAQILMDQMQMDGFFRKIDTQMLQGVSSLPPSNDPHTRQVVSDTTEMTADAVEVAAEVVTEGGLDLLDTGVDFFLDIVSGIGELF
ncbi:MAG TPA: zf-TFIIB domain-containing protein [Myxococcaceae bacterium]|jgi:Zn-finger nucleic acid-binding protein